MTGKIRQMEGLGGHNSGLGGHNAIYDILGHMDVSKLTQPMAKRLKLFGDDEYLVGKISRSNCFFQGPLAE